MAKDIEPFFLKNCLGRGWQGESKTIRVALFISFLVLGFGVVE